MGLARILDQMDLVGSGQVEEGLHLCGLPIEVDRNDGSSFWGYRGSSCRGVEGEGRGVDIRQDRLSSDALVLHGLPETVKKFSILPEDFTVDSGELTPSLKVKRRIIQKRYEGLIDAFYEEKFE